MLIWLRNVLVFVRDTRHTTRYTPHATPISIGMVLLTGLINRPIGLLTDLRRGQCVSAGVSK